LTITGVAVEKLILGKRLEPSPHLDALPATSSTPTVLSLGDRQTASQTMPDDFEIPDFARIGRHMF
jgi:hypothetical protein